MWYRRNTDSKIRRLERQLAISNSREDALELYYARKRAGDPRAGYEWYSWLLEKADQEGEVMAEPDSTVWLVDEKFYCDTYDCGEQAAFAAAYEDGSLPLTHWASGYEDHPDYAEYAMDAARDYVRELYAYPNLFELLKDLPNMEYPLRIMDRNLAFKCAGCDCFLKLRNHPATWIESLQEPPTP